MADINTMQQTGTEFARTKEAQAAIMRAKQDAGTEARGKVMIRGLADPGCEG